MVTIREVWELMEYVFIFHSAESVIFKNLRFCLTDNNFNQIFVNRKKAGHILIIEREITLIYEMKFCPIRPRLRDLMRFSMGLMMFLN